MRALSPALACLRRLRGDRAGATAIEYGLIAALIVIAMIASLKGLADATSGTWNNTSKAVQSVSPH
jgi:pilus assembly protein Flp/PilA